MNSFEMGGIPQPNLPEKETKIDLDIKTEKAIEWYKNTFKLWDNIYKGNTPEVPIDPEEAQSYIDKFVYLKEHNQEKYRDKEGIEFYKRLDEYIEKLKTVK